MFAWFKRMKLRSLSPLEVQSLHEKGEITLVDVREQNEWAEGHVEGAVLAPLSMLAHTAADLPCDKPIVFYCRSGVRSGKAAELAQKLGLAHDTHMDGGILAWVKASLPVVR